MVCANPTQVTWHAVNIQLTDGDDEYDCAGTSLLPHTHFQVKNALILRSFLQTALACCQPLEERWSGDGGWCEPQINLWLQTVTAAHTQPQRHCLAPPWCYANVNSCHFWSRRHRAFRRCGDRRLLKATVHVCVFNLSPIITHTTLSREQQRCQEQQTSSGQKQRYKEQWSKQELIKDQALRSADVRCIRRCLESPQLSTGVRIEAHMHACTSRLAVIKLLDRQKPCSILRENKSPSLFILYH